MAKRLVFVKCYYKTAVYLDGVLLLSELDQHVSFNLLRALGFEPSLGREIPTHDYWRADFGADEQGHWTPPQHYSTLEEQWAGRDARQKRERIAALKDELRQLEGVIEVKVMDLPKSVAEAISRNLNEGKADRP